MVSSIHVRYKATSYPEDVLSFSSEWDRLELESKGNYGSSSLFQQDFKQKERKSSFSCQAPVVKAKHVMLDNLNYNG